MKKIIFTFLLVLVFALPVHAAEMVTIENVSKDDVYNQVLTNCMRSGFTIQDNTKHSLIFRNDKSGLNFAIIWGSKAYTQHVFNIAQTGEDVLLSYEMRVVDGNQVHPLSKESIPYYVPVNRESAEIGLQNTLHYLVDTKAHFNGLYLYGFTDSLKKKKDYVEVVKTIHGFPAEATGLKAGDKIKKINSQSLKQLSYPEFDIILSRGTISGQSIVLEIERDSSIINYEITPKFTSSQELKHESSFFW